LNDDLVKYYKDRAKEYENIYLKPERLDELKEIEDILQKIFKDKVILEIACGTGYWTEKISKTAKSILATDINDSVLEVAKNKTYLNNNVKFQKQDLFSFKPKTKFESLLGGFIWSHVKLQELNSFIKKTNSFIMDEGTVVLMDNNYVKGSSHTIISKDEFGNTYQTRKLKNGSVHNVLKNFPAEEFIRKKLESIVSEINFIKLKYFWIVIYKI